MSQCIHFLEVGPTWKINCPNCGHWNPDIMRCGDEDKWSRGKK